MGKRGPRPKTKSELKATGSYRPWRQGARGENAGFSSGRPEPSRRLTAEEQLTWDYVCANVPPDLLSPADRDALLSLCWWQDYAEQLMASMAAGGADDKTHRKLKDAEQVRRLLWGQFGLMPVARARMLPTGPAKDDGKENPIAQILKMREGKRKPG